MNTKHSKKSIRKAFAAFAASMAAFAVWGSSAGDALAPFVASGELPGAIGVFCKKGAEEVTCAGWADVAQQRPITIDSPFMECSQTKGFCGVTIAILVERGEISLDDPVSKYLPEFGEMWVEAGKDENERRFVRAKNQITIRMVMNHTAGFPFELPHYQDMGGWSRKMPLRSVAIVAASLPLLFEPGTNVRYSNTGIDIGAAVVEVVTGRRWEDFLKDEVLDPLGMDSTTFWPTDEQLANKIEMYSCQKGAPAKFKLHDPSMQRPYNDKFVFASAGAGLWTTVRDQLKFYKMLMNLGLAENGKRILREDTVKNLLALSTRPEGLGGYSLGLTAPEQDGEDACFGHGGAWGTYCQVNWHKKQLRLWVVQLTDGPRPWDVPWKAAADKFFEEKADSSAVEAYTGRLQ